MRNVKPKCAYEFCKKEITLAVHWKLYCDELCKAKAQYQRSVEKSGKTYTPRGQGEGANCRALNAKRRNSPRPARSRRIET
jgi:hypothetical protein